MVAYAAAAAALALPFIAYHRLAYAVAVCVALLPTYLIRFSIGQLPSTLLEVLLLELFAVWIVRRQPSDSPRLTKLESPVVLLLIGATFGALVSPDLRGALGVWRAYFIEPLLFFLVFVTTVRAVEERRLVLAALGAATIVIGLTAVYQKITGVGIPNPFWQAEATRRVTSFYGFPNAIGLFIAPILPLMAGWLADLWNRGRKLAPLMLLPAAALILGTLAIFFAVSEGAIIGAAAGFLAFGLAWRPGRAAALGAIIAGCLVVSLYAPATRYATGIFSMSDDSTSVRQIVWQGSLAMLADHPVFGAGLDGYQEIMAAYHKIPGIEIFMYPHNVFLNFWSETGLIGLVGFAWLVGLMIANLARMLGRKPDSALPAALLGSILALLVHGLVDVPYFKNDLAVLFWILAAFCLAPLYEGKKA